MVAGWPTALQALNREAHDLGWIAGDAANASFAAVANALVATPKLEGWTAAPLGAAGASVLALLASPSPFGVGPAAATTLNLCKQGIGEQGSVELLAAVDGDGDGQLGRNHVSR